MNEHDWHRPMEDNPYCDVQLPSLPPKYKWTCSKCGKVAYRDCSKGEPPRDGCTGASDSGYRELYHELKDAVNELQKKQPYCFDPDNPIETLQTIGNFIDEVNNGICRNHARTTQPLEDILSKELSEASRMDVGPDDPHIAALARSIRESVIEEIGYTVKKAIE